MSEIARNENHLIKLIESLQEVLDLEPIGKILSYTISTIFIALTKNINPSRY